MTNEDTSTEQSSQKTIDKQITHAGFKYTLNRTTEKACYYACSSRRTKKDGLCKARMILNILTGNVTMTGIHECSKVIEKTITLETINIQKEV
jgi:hypothetical protein